MYDVLICDNSRPDRQQLRSLLVRYQLEQNEEGNVREFAYKDIPPLPECISLYFMDTSSQDEFVHTVDTIRNKSHENMILLLFTEMQTLMTAMTPKVLPSGMLHKPVKYEDIQNILSMLPVQQSDLASEPTYTYTKKARTVSIPYRHILFFESRNKKTYLVTEAQEHELYVPLDTLEQELAISFVRTHRSFLVNRKRIREYDFGSMTVTLDDGTEVLISRSCKENLKHMEDER